VVLAYKGIHNVYSNTQLKEHIIMNIYDKYLEEHDGDHPSYCRCDECKAVMRDEQEIYDNYLETHNGEHPSYCQCDECEAERLLGKDIGLDIDDLDCDDVGVDPAY
jgi:hypothetical protein